MANKAQNLAQSNSAIRIADVNAVAKYRLINQSSRKSLTPDFYFATDIMSTLARLGKNQGMKMLPDGTRNYIFCKNYPEIQLTARYIFECPSITVHILKIG